jgi:hypothetical protein
VHGAAELRHAPQQEPTAGECLLLLVSVVGQA